MTTTSIVCSSISSRRRLRRGRTVLVLALCLAGVVGAASVRAQEAVAAEPAELTEGRRLFDALEYEGALPLLDRVIAQLGPQAVHDPARRGWLLSAHEMRARARFGVGDHAGAEADFRSVLLIEPSYALDAGVSPRVVALLDDVRKTTIGIVQLTLEPADAALLVDGVPMSVTENRLLLPAGAHLLRAIRPGYRAVDQPVSVDAGETLPLAFTLERATSVLTVLTSPAGVEIVLNGQTRGRTAEGPPPAELNDVPGRLGVPPSDVSQPFVIGDVGTGSFELEFRRECYETERRTLRIESLDDYLLDPLQLTPAVGTIVVESVPPGAELTLNGRSRGRAPATLSEVCAGAHVVELRGPEGRAVERVALDTGATVSVQGVLKPAFVLLAPATAMTGGDQARALTANALADAAQVLLVSPPVDEAVAALQQDPVDDLWFGLAEGERVPSPEDRRLRIGRLAERFDAQGVAWLQPDDTGSVELRLALVAAGSAEPDHLTFRADSPGSVTQALTRLNTRLPLLRPSLGALVIDVLGQEGAVVARTDGGPAQRAGLASGDLIVAANGQPVASGAALEGVVSGLAPGETLTLAVTGAGGATRSVTLTLAEAPALVTGTDRFLPGSVAIATLRTRLAAAGDGPEAHVLRLNLAAALLRAGDPAGARELLEQTTLPEGPGVSQGTVLYLLGQAFAASGDPAGARRAWEAASALPGRLTDDGPLVRSLAARALARLP